LSTMFRRAVANSIMTPKSLLNPCGLERTPYPYG
jgi:hypothetical protein